MIDFLKYRYWGFAFFALTVAAFVGGYLYKYQTRGYTFVYSVDFTGGTQVLLDFSQPTSGENVMKALEQNGLPGAVTRQFSPTKVLVRVKQFESDATGLAARIKQTLENALSGTQVTIDQVDSVGGGVGESLRWKSLRAVIVGLLLMLLYIAARFWSWGFALGSIISLFHDVLVVLTIFLLLDIEISINIIAAILTVLGYSINDTIIIFSRIRESMARHTGKTLEEITNISINETLRRTLLTSFATTLVVLSLVLFGGEVLRGLALVLLIGFVFGTYSSIFVASPFMLMFTKRQ
jgi:preprotein translocase subunit SecF